MKYFISVTDATPEEFNQILTLTEEIKNKRKNGARKDGHRKERRKSVCARKQTLRPCRGKRAACFFHTTIVRHFAMLLPY